MLSPEDVATAEIKQDVNSDWFTDVASKWDQKPSVISVTDAMAAAVKKMSWYVSVKNEEEKRLREMDFGCGTGFLTYKILDPKLVHEVVGVDVADGMIDAFKEKMKANNSDYKEYFKMTAVNADLSQIDLETLNSMVGGVSKPVKGIKNEGFDLVYTLLAFHHIKEPEKMLNNALKDKYINPGGRMVLMDYEHDETKQTYHPPPLKIVEHFEYDGFSESEIRGWFENGNDSTSTRKCDLSTLEITRVPFLDPVDPEDEDLIPKRKVETHTMFVATCCIINE